jgi:mono/diheme cytochrome c family protein
MFAPLERNSKRAWLAGLATLLLALPAAVAAAQQKPTGVEVWGASCGQCHRVRAVDAYDARQWDAIVTHMALTARLTPDETDAVREFLVGAARARETRQGGAAAARAQREPLTLASTAATFVGIEDTLAVGRSLYTAQCVACHGRSGKGDGPAAAAMNPRPANLADAARMAKVPDDSLVQVITTGHGGMPGYGKILTSEQIRAVVAYLRTLKP